MIEKGKRYRLVNILSDAADIEGHIVTIGTDYGDGSYRAIFDDPEDQGWMHWLDDTIVFEDELEPIEAE